MRKLVGLGVDEHYAAMIAYDRKGYWFNANNKAVNWALNKERLIHWGFYDLSSAYQSVQLDCSEEFRLLNFDESTYINAQGHKQPCFNMTRDGFVFLVMGYRGKKAASFKEAYIKRFNEMEEFIKYLLEARTEFPLLTDNIMLLHEHPKHYHFSNEADMLTRIALGKTAKQIREEHGLKQGTSIRPYLTTKQIEAIDLLQRVDIGLLVSTPDFQERKRYLEWYYMKKLQ